MAQEDSPVIETNRDIEIEKIEPGGPTTTKALDYKEAIQIKIEHEQDTDGGFWAWATVISAFLIQSTGFGYSNAFGVYQDYYVRTFLTDNTSSQISWIGSTQSFLMLTMGFFTGRLFDKGYCYHLVIIGSVLQVVSLFLLSLCKPNHYYQVFLSQALGVGIGSSLCYLPSLAVLAHHFRSPGPRAIAMCIAVAGSSLGGLVHPIMINALFHGVSSGSATNSVNGLETSNQIQSDFARGVRASAGLVAGMQMVAVLLMRTRYPKDTKEQSDKVNEGRKKVDEVKKLFELIKKFSADWPYVCFCLGMTFSEIVFFFPAFYIQLYAIKQGLNPTFAFYCISILNGSSFLGRLVPGFLSHRLGVANMFLASTCIVAVLIFCMLAARSVAGITAFAVLYGFFSGAYITLMSPMLAILSDGPGEIGARMGMCFAITGFGSLTGTPIAGALLTSEFTWWRPIVFGGITTTVADVLFAYTRIALSKRHSTLWIV